MPFMRSRGALRRTLQFLEKGEIILRDDLKVLSFGITVPYKKGKRFPHHEGLFNFVFWHMPQLKYKNPKVQVLTFKAITPTPWIKAYILDAETNQINNIVIDCDSRSRQEIHDHVKIVLGKSEHEFDKDYMYQWNKRNPANFGYNYKRQCICEVPGQRPCPGWDNLPKSERGLTGKWRADCK